MFSVSVNTATFTVVLPAKVFPPISTEGQAAEKTTIHQEQNDFFKMIRYIMMHANVVPVQTPF